MFRFIAIYTAYISFFATCFFSKVTADNILCPEGFQLKYEGLTLGCLIPNTLTQSAFSTKPFKYYVCFSLENNSEFKIVNSAFVLEYQLPDMPKTDLWRGQHNLDLSLISICSVFDKYSAVSLDVKDKLYYFIRIENPMDFQKYPSRIVASLTIKTNKKYYYDQQLIYSAKVIAKEQKWMYFPQQKIPQQADLLKILHYEDGIISIAFRNSNKNVGQAIDFYYNPTDERYNLHLSVIDKKANKELGFLGLSKSFLNKYGQSSPIILLTGERFTYKGYLDRIYIIQGKEALGRVPKEELRNKALLLRGKYTSSKEFHVHEFGK